MKEVSRSGRSTSSVSPAPAEWLAVTLALLAVFNPFVVHQVLSDRDVRSWLNFLPYPLLVIAFGLAFWRACRRWGRPRLKQTAVKIAGTFAVLACAAVGGELLLRAMMPSMAKTVEVAGNHDRIGWSPGIPYEHISLQDYDSGAIYRERLNSRGWRDSEHTFAKTRPRVLLLGDSQAFGKGVKFPDTIGQQLQRVLGSKAEVLVIACSGWSTDQQLLALRTEGFKYSPDVVVILFSAGNDPRGNSEGGLVPTKSPKPAYTIVDGKLKFLWEPPFRDILRRTAHKSYLALQLRRMWNFVDQYLPPDEKKRPKKRPEWPYVDSTWFLVNEDDDIRAAWELTGALLKETNDACAANGAKLLVYPYGEYAGRNVVQWKTGGKTVDLDRKHPYDRLRDIARQRGLTLIQETTDTQKRFETKDLQFKWNIHLNTDGGGAVAQTIAQSITPILKTSAVDSQTTH